MTAALKAYEVRDNYEGHCVIEYATNGATARREGASALDIEWSSVESCRRAPQFDEYAPGPVPPMVLLRSGWWMTCRHCTNKISLGLDEDELKPEPHVAGEDVFCNATCCALHAARERGQEAAQSALSELVYTWFPEATITRIHVYGDRLEAREFKNGLQVGGVKASVSFNLPGLKHGVSFLFGEMFFTTEEDEAEFATRITADMPPMRKSQATASSLH